MKLQSDGERPFTPFLDLRHFLQAWALGTIGPLDHHQRASSKEVLSSLKAWSYICPCVYQIQNWEFVGLHVIAGGRFWCPWTRVLPDYWSPSSGVYPDDQFCGIFPANSITVRRK